MFWVVFIKFSRVFHKIVVEGTPFFFCTFQKILSDEYFRDLASKLVTGEWLTLATELQKVRD